MTASSLKIKSNKNISTYLLGFLVLCFSSSCSLLEGSSSNSSSSPIAAGTSTPLPSAVINTLANSTYPIDDSHPPLIQGNTYVLASAYGPLGLPTALTCTYQTLDLSPSDPNYAPPGTDCTQLQTLTTSGSPATTVVGNVSISSASTSASQVSWTPTSTQRGTYQFNFTAFDGGTPTSQTLTVTVREDDTTLHLLSALDALNATAASGLSSSTASAPYAAGTNGNWLNLLSSASTGSLNFGTADPWAGSGQCSVTAVDPYRLTFNSADSDSISLGSALNSTTQFAVEAWVKPGSNAAASVGTVIASNGGANGNGFVLRQANYPSPLNTSNPLNRAEFVVGQKYYSYRDLVLSDHPIGYWRLNETSGTTANDLSASGNNGTYDAGITLGQPGPFSESGDSSTSALFPGNSSDVMQASLPSSQTSNVSLEAWIYPTASSNGASSFIIGINGSGGYALILQNGAGGSGLIPAITIQGITWNVTGSTQAITMNNWHYVAAVEAGTTWTVYVDGVSVGTPTSQAPTSPTGPIDIGMGIFGNIADAAFYNYPLSSTQITNHYKTGAVGRYVSYPGNAVLADNPVGYWRLGEKSGQTAYDISGNGNNGTYVGGYTLGEPGVLTGDSDTAIRFDGSSGYVTMGSVAALQNSSTVSISAWVNLTRLSGFQMIAGSEGAYKIDVTSSGNVRFLTGNNWAGAILTSATTLSTGSWYHIVGTYSGSTKNIYINGTRDTNTLSTTGSLGTQTYASIAANNNPSYYLSGTIDEVAFFNYPLSSTQITNHYNSGKGTGWWYCQSQTQLNTSNWNLLSALYNGTTAQLFINGQQECSVTPGTTYSGSVASTNIGADTNRSSSSFWQGALTLFRLFGTSDGVTAPASSTSIAADFAAESNRFRSVPVENIVTNGLILHLDAANAQQGTSAYSNGCTSSALSWFDLSSNGYSGTLNGFSSCGATQGWVGAGTSSSPYALTFDGVDDSVSIPYQAAFNAYPITIGSWFQTTSSTGNPALVNQYLPSSSNGYQLFMSNGALCGWYFKDGSDSVYDSTGCTLKTSGYNDGKWHYATMVVNSSGGTLYVDGAQKATQAWTGTAGATTTAQNLTIGYYPSNSYFNGSIGSIQIYNQALSLQQIKQNCLAQQGRYGVTSCNSP